MPAPLSSCRLANITTSSLSLTCQRPGTPKPPETTLYRAEVYLHNSTLLANVTSSTPSFNVSHLKSDTSFQIKVYVSQGPATSEPVVVSGYTSRTSRIEIEVPKEPESHVGIYAGVGAGALLVVVMVVAARSYCRRERRQGHHTYKDELTASVEDSNPDIISNIDDTYVQMTESMAGGFTGEITITRSPSMKQIAADVPDVNQKKQVPMCRADYCLAVEMSGSPRMGSYSSTEDTQVVVPVSSSYSIPNCPISSSCSIPCNIQGGGIISYPRSSGMIIPCHPSQPTAPYNQACHSAVVGAHPHLISDLSSMGSHPSSRSGSPLLANVVPFQQASGDIIGCDIRAPPEGYCTIPQLNMINTTGHGLYPITTTSVISSSSQGLCPLPQASQYTCPTIAVSEPSCQQTLIQQNEESFV